MIDLDANATTRPEPEVVSAVLSALAETYHNPSSVHRLGQLARHTVELAREHVASLIGASPKDLTFTATGTEAIDLAIRGSLAARHPTSSVGQVPSVSVGQASGLPARPIVVSTRVEHAAVRDLLDHIAKRSEIDLRHLPIDDSGRVREDALASTIIPGTALVSVQWANNETGVIQPVAAIAAAARAAGATFHCDGTQWVGKLPTDVSSRSADTSTHFAGDILTFSPHKFHGPKGVGVMYMRPGTPIAPRIHGTQERGRRGGTENVPAIAGAGVAARLALEWLSNLAARDALAALRDRFERRILEGFGGASVNGAGPRLWNTTNIAFPRLSAEALLLALSEKGVYASAGAACSSGSLDPSPVLLAMGIASGRAIGSLRFSLTRHTTEDELHRAAEIILAAATRLRSVLR